MYDLVIQKGTLITPDGPIQADLAISGERIAAIGHELTGQETIDASSLLVLPGAVDPHVHLEMPTAVTRTSEDWASGTLAAAYGGTTTVIDFVEPEENQTLIEAFKQRQQQAQSHAAIDYSLHMTLTNTDEDTLAQLPEVTAQGILSFKLYTTYPGFALTDSELLRALLSIRQAGGIALIHCENDAIIQVSTAALLADGKIHPRYHSLSRPVEAEIEAIGRVITLAGYTNTPLYVVHISTGGGAAAVQRARVSGRAVYGETCPQYLLLDQRCMDVDDPLMSASLICAPPLRPPGEAAQLWAGLANGTLMTVGTDHCTFNIDGQKDAGRNCFLDVPGGLPGIESRLSLLYTYGVGTGRLTLQQWVAICCTNPAQIFGLWPRKGSLLPGADADIVLFDPHKQVTLSKSILHEQVDYTPYEGMELTGYPVGTILRGRWLISDGSSVSDQRTGQFLSRRSLKSKN
jgi:dihydropyrimidinase